ncbi:MAG: hypothetical protein ACR2P3_00265 [Geminicoccaceae bacterium]
MDARGLAHECRVEATFLRTQGHEPVNRAACAAILERCATTLEEMDATDRATESSLDDIEAQALGVYRQAGGGSSYDMHAANLAEMVMNLCAYLKKEKAVA